MGGYAPPPERHPRSRMQSPGPDASRAAHFPPIPGLRRVLICGPVAEVGQPARGGFQSANLRVMDVLRRLGAEVDALRYPDRDGNLLTKILVYTFVFLRIAAAIMFGNPRGCAIHFTPYAKQFMLGECALILIARLRGYRVVIDLRAGSKQEIYNTSGPLHRATFRMALRSAHAVSFEGRAYDAFVAEVAPEKPRFYLPNFIAAEELRQRQSFDPEGPTLVYVGIVSEDKGALATIALARRLRDRLPGARLTFIGRLHRAIEPQLRALGGSEPWIEFTGALPPDQMRARLDEAHFFVFLTLWRGEGHSNALTEAMGRGCVPIVTRHGFLPDVVGPHGFILDDREQTEAAVSWMAACWNETDWMSASRAVVDRVAQNFVDLGIDGILHDIYSAAFA